MTNHKLIPNDAALLAFIREVRELPSKNNIVLATGCFDIIHRGHISLLEKASTMGWLVVGINSDKAVRHLKGTDRPINNQDDRCYVLASLACVHRVFVIDDIRVAHAITLIQPDIWVKGNDYTMESLAPTEVAAAKAAGSEIVFVPVLKGYSTTAILSKL